MVLSQEMVSWALWKIWERDIPALRNCSAMAAMIDFYEVSDFSFKVLDLVRSALNVWVCKILSNQGSGGRHCAKA